jgi:hypothetical protein
MSQKVFKKEKILDIVEMRPGISAPEVAVVMDISRVSAYHYLSTLVSEHLLRIDGKGKATRYFPRETTYMRENLPVMNRINPSELTSFKQEIIFGLYQKYEEVISEEDLGSTFEKYCMYIAPDDTIFTGFEAFLLWCTDPRHNFSDRIIEKAIEYLDIIGTIEYLRGKNNFLDGGSAAKTNLKGYMDIGFDFFYFCMSSVIRNGYGNTRTSIELRYGKKNSNAYLLEQAIEAWVDPVRIYVGKNEVDAVVYTPPTEGRLVQFRDVLRKLLDLHLPEIRSEKIPPFGKINEPQKDIKDKEKRVKNAIQSLIVTIPKELMSYKHILILDDSFTTGATPNAIALKLREAGYVGKVTIITICGSFDYDLAVSEEEI